MKLGELIKSVQIKICEIRNSIVLKLHHVEVGKDVKIYGAISISGNSGIVIGNECRFNAGKGFNKIGGDVRLLLRADNGGSILLGNNVGISNSAIVSLGEGIIIQDNVMIGGSCKIYDTDFHSVEYNMRMTYPDLGIRTKQVLIKEGAFVGAHSIILKGVTIGVHSVVGAGSVVTKDIPDYEIWAGNPARYIKTIEC